MGNAQFPRKYGLGDILKGGIFLGTPGVENAERQKCGALKVLLDCLRW